MQTIFRKSSNFSLKMAKQVVSMSLAFIVLSMVWYGAMAQSTDCTNVIISMSPCLNYITGNSSNPSSSCCSQLSTIVRSQPQCLCQVLNGGGSNLGLNINQTQALALPRTCNVQTPPISRCNASSPTTSPAGSAPSSPNKNPGDGTSDASSSTIMAAHLMCSLLFITIYVSIFSMT